MTAKRIVVPAVLLAVIVLVAAWWLALSRTESAEEFAAEVSAAARQAREPPKPGSKSEVIAIGSPGPSLPASPVLAAKYEMRDAIRDTTDLRAYYERTKDLPDPTGERAYRMAEAIFECTAFMDLPVPDLSARLALTKQARESPRRQEAFNAMVERCKGFSGNPRAVAELMQGLHRKAEAASYPAEVARSLRMESERRDPEAGDKTAISLLSAPTPDPDVVHELAQYLNFRMAGHPDYRGIDAAALAVAWGLLECQYGADCGPRSRPVTMTCIAYGACDLTRVEDAIVVQGSQATVNNAVELRDRIARQIAERDWKAVGLAPRSKAP